MRWRRESFKDGGHAARRQSRWTPDGDTPRSDGHLLGACWQADRGLTREGEDRIINELLRVLRVVHAVATTTRDEEVVIERSCLICGNAGRPSVD